MKTLDPNDCATGYTEKLGDVAGHGTINGKGGESEVVAKCDECATLCNNEILCKSYECSATMLKCNLNTLALPTSSTPFRD